MLEKSFLHFPVVVNKVAELFSIESLCNDPLLIVEQVYDRCRIDVVIIAEVGGVIQIRNIDPFQVMFLDIVLPKINIRFNSYRENLQIQSGSTDAVIISGK